MGRLTVQGVQVMGGRLSFVAEGDTVELTECPPDLQVVSEVRSATV